MGAEEGAVRADNQVAAARISLWFGTGSGYELPGPFSLWRARHYRLQFFPQGCPEKRASIGSPAAR